MALAREETHGKHKKVCPSVPTKLGWCGKMDVGKWMWEAPSLEPDRNEYLIETSFFREGEETLLGTCFGRKVRATFSFGRPVANLLLESGRGKWVAFGWSIISNPVLRQGIIWDFSYFLATIKNQCSCELSRTKEKFKLLLPYAIIKKIFIKP